MKGKLLLTPKFSYLSGQAEPKDIFSSYTVLYVTEDFLKKNPNTAGAIVRAMIKATDLIKTNPNEAVQVLVEPMRVPAEDLKAIMSKIDWEVGFSRKFEQEWNVNSDWLFKEKKQKFEVSARRAGDTSIMRAVDPKRVGVDW